MVHHIRRTGLAAGPAAVLRTDLVEGLVAAHVRTGQGAAVRTVTGLAEDRRDRPVVDKGNLPLVGRNLDSLADLEADLEEDDCILGFRKAAEVEGSRLAEADTANLSTC